MFFWNGQIFGQISPKKIFVVNLRTEKKAAHSGIFRRQNYAVRRRFGAVRVTTRREDVLVAWRAYPVMYKSNNYDF